MRNPTLLAVGIGAIVLAFVGPGLAGAFSDQGSASWGSLDQMRGWHMQGGGLGMMNGVSDDFGSGQVPPSINGAAEITVTLDDFSISPPQVVVVDGRPTNITVVNKGVAPHDFTVPGLDIRIEVAPGQTVTTGTEPQPAGTYDTLCTIGGHASLGMVGSFVVQGET